MTLTTAPRGATTILLIRHGETAWNAERRLQGHLDIPLNAEGERQAALLGAALAGEAIDHVLSSDLGRARQTAEAILRARGIAPAVQVDPQLRERCYGGFEGLLYSRDCGPLSAGVCRLASAQHRCDPAARQQPG